ncbi:hypothetical protein [Mycoplasma sp. E35C]|nr:hypothetical protein [Mycoplasma sp. E35C]QZX49323.1 hypothetical protein JJE79_01035 [Mycoplasma sp. E35C]
MDRNDRKLKYQKDEFLSKEFIERIFRALKNEPEYQNYLKLMEELKDY